MLPTEAHTSLCLCHSPLECPCRCRHMPPQLLNAALLVTQACRSALHQTAPLIL
jgi:hypothetical protein